MWWSLLLLHLKTVKSAVTLVFLIAWLCYKKPRRAWSVLLYKASNYPFLWNIIVNIYCSSIMYFCKSTDFKKGQIMKSHFLAHLGIKQSSWFSFFVGLAGPHSSVRPSFSCFSTFCDTASLRLSEGPTVPSIAHLLPVFLHSPVTPGKTKDQVSHPSLKPQLVLMVV